MDRNRDSPLRRHHLRFLLRKFKKEYRRNLFFPDLEHLTYDERVVVVAIAVQGRARSFPRNYFVNGKRLPGTVVESKWKFVVS